MSAIKQTVIGKGIAYLLENGIVATLAKAKRKVKRTVKYKKIANEPLYTRQELDEQQKTVFPKNIKFSILVPLYNTPEKFLREMIQSVLDQTYANWELCLADGSDTEHADVEKICMSYSHMDRRIRYQKLEKNMGISGNTNVCIDMATGDYVSLFDHDDLLHPAALFENMKVICGEEADFIYTDENTFHENPKDAFCPHFKSDYAPDTLRANNYICHFTTVKKSLLDSVGKFRSECDGSQDFDMMLRLTEKAEKIVHIPRILYYWRAHKNSVADSIDAKPYVVTAAKRAISDHLHRVGLKGDVLDSAFPSMYRLRYEIEGEPLVSVLIPVYGHKQELETCLNSIFEKTTYKNYEVIVIGNNSQSQEIFSYYREVQNKRKNLKVVVWDGPINYSAVNNFGARFASGEHLLLLNNDTEVVSHDWIQELLMYSQRKDIGAVGAKLYYPNNTIRHAGFGVDLLHISGRLHHNFEQKDPGYMGRLTYAHNVSAVSGECIMVRREVWDQIGGLDETFTTAFYDIDLCMHIRKAGYLIVWTPFSELYYHGAPIKETIEKQVPFMDEKRQFQTRWKETLEKGDLYYKFDIIQDM